MSVPVTPGGSRALLEREVAAHTAVFVLWSAAAVRKTLARHIAEPCTMQLSDAGGVAELNLGSGKPLLLRGLQYRAWQAIAELRTFSGASRVVVDFLRCEEAFASYLASWGRWASPRMDDN